MSKTLRTIATIIGVALVILVVVGAGAFFVFGMGRGFGFAYPYRMMAFPFGGGFLSLLLGVLVIGSLIWMILSIGRQPQQSGAATPVVESALDILKKRYAKGEINKEQFDQMRHDLEV
jgi:putative membrane protein